jgi:predicted nucleic acid-binding protein
MSAQTVPILVDSSYFIERLRAGVDVRQELMPYLANCDLYNCGIIRAEVLRGLKEPPLYRQMKAFFDIIPEIPLSLKAWTEISELAWKLDRSSGNIHPLRNVIIAYSALQVGAVLVSGDAHFQDIPNLKVVPELP